MSDKFPKTYVIDRLKARRASLQAKLDAGYDASQRYLHSTEAEAEAWLKATREKLARLAKDDGVADSAPWTKLQRLRESIYSLYQAAPNAPGQGYRRRDEPENVAEWRNSRQQWTAEVNKIDHALAYLDELPTDELSITALTKLKLTDAIAFDLSIDKPKRGR